MHSNHQNKMEQLIIQWTTTGKRKKKRIQQRSVSSIRHANHYALIYSLWVILLPHLGFKNCPINIDQLIILLFRLFVVMVAMDLAPNWTPIATYQTDWPNMFWQVLSVIIEPFQLIYTIYTVRQVDEKIKNNQQKKVECPTHTTTQFGGKVKFDFVQLLPEINDVRPVSNGHCHGRESEFGRHIST